MYPRIEEILASTALSVGGTGEYRLPKAGHLAGLMIHLDNGEYSNAHKATEKWRLEDFIDQVQVLGNGTFEIVDTTGRILNAEAFYNNGLNHLGWRRTYAAGTNRAILSIAFGRYFGDPSYTLDLSRFNNVNLKIKNDAASTDWGSFSGHVYGLFFEDIPADLARDGFFRTQVFDTHTPTADGYWPIDLPTEGKLRRVYAQLDPQSSSALPSDAVYNVIYDAKLSLRSGKITVFDIPGYDLMHFPQLISGFDAITSGAKDTTVDNGINTGLGRLVGVAAAAISESGSVETVVPTFDDRQDGFLNAEGSPAQGITEFIARGLAPEMTIGWFADPRLNGMDYIDLNAEKQVTFRYHSRSTMSGTTHALRTVVNRLVSEYP